MTGTVPGQEPAVLIAVIVCGLLLFIPLFIYLCFKTGLKQTIGLFTIGIWPLKRRGPQQRPPKAGRAPRDR